MFVHQVDSPPGPPVSALRCSHCEGRLPDSCCSIGRVWRRRGRHVVWTPLIRHRQGREPTLTPPTAMLSGTDKRRRQVFPSVPLRRDP